MEGKVALILPYDQALRIIYQRGPKQFQTDKEAREITEALWRTKEYRKLPLQQQMFVFLPYHHVEDKILQKRAYKVFKELYKKDPKQFLWIYRASKVRNRIMNRFGRFPHRNKDIGRKSTKAELNFLRVEWPKLVRWVWAKDETTD